MSQHWDHVIKNGKIVNSNEIYEGNIYIRDGKIVSITKEELKGRVLEETDASNCYVLPGLMDTHVHSRDPGATHKEDFYHSSMAAAIGGLTTVFEMPNTNPPINNVENLHKQINHLKQRAFVDYAIWGVTLGELNLDDIQALSDAGVIGFKFLWGYAIDKDTLQIIYNYNSNMNNAIPPLGDGEAYDIFREVAKTGKILSIHAENTDLIEHLTKQVQAGDSRDYEALLRSRPNLVEETAIQTAIALAKDTDLRLHILHLGAGEGVDLVKQAQEQGYPITVETCPHFLYLNNEDYNRVGPMIKVYPPVKYRKDQERLWKGINQGIISIVCSDHAPHTEEEKQGDLWSIPAGMCGVETLAPMMINAVSEGRITIQQVVALLSENPAKMFGIYPEKGSIQVGTDADITIVDMNKNFTIEREKLHSKSKVTAFDGFEIKGCPVQTIIRGNTVMKNGRILNEPTGKFINPNKVSNIGK